MSTYTKTTNFTAKDNLTSGDPAKVIKGSEFDTEFNSIETAVNSKANANNGTHTGTTTISTANIDTLQVDGVEVTATPAELNTLDGITSTTAELNKLDGFSGDFNDLNYAKDLRATGVTSAEFDTLDGITATTAELNTLDGITSTTAELNILDGVTATTAELNFVDGVTSNIQTQLDSKASATASPTITLGGDLSGSATLTNLGSATITATVADDSHNHVISNVDGLQTALDGKATTAQGALADSAVQPDDNVSFGTGSFSGAVDVIGTITANAADIAGAITADGLTVSNTGADIYLTSADTGQSKVFFGGASSDEKGSIRYSDNSDWMRFYTDSKLALELDSNGDVSFYEDTGTTAKMVWSSSAESLGIGTSPSHALHINTTATAGRQNLEAIDKASQNLIKITNPQYATDASAGMVFRVFPDSDARQGAGIIASGGGSNNSTDISLFVTDASAVSYAPYRIAGQDGTHTFYTAPSTEAMRIDSAGNVGIGTASPSSVLHARGAGNPTLTIDGSDGAYTSFLTLKAAGAGASVIRAEGGTNTLVLQTNGDNERARFDSSGNLGIGTTSPLSYRKMTIQSNGSSGGIALNNSAGTLGAQFTLENTGTSTDLGIYSTGVSKFYTGGTERARIDSSGNVGIGLTNPQDKLHVAGGKIKVTGSGNVASYGYIKGTETTFNTHTFTLGTTYGYDVDVDALSIYNGNVGIGTDSPIFAFGGGLQIKNSTTANLRITKDTYTGLDLMQGSDGEAYIYNRDNGFIAIGTNNTERARIDSSGNLLVGGTTYEGSVTSNASSSYLAATGFISANVTNDFGMQVNRTGTDGKLFNFRKDGLDVGSIATVAGNIAIGNGNASLYISNATDSLTPTSLLTGTPVERDAGIDIGRTTARFKDLYLSGGVYLGGTGAANKLDDYEEGFWDVVVTGTGTAGTCTYGNRRGSYTKIGNTVTASVFISWTAHTGSGNINISLPYTNTSSYGTSAAYSAVTIGEVTRMTKASSETIVGYTFPGQAKLGLYRTDGINVTQAPVSLVATGSLLLTVTYRTA